MNINLWKYRVGVWAFRWVSDNEGDIGFCLLGLITFIKYKEVTLVYVGCPYGPAGKYQGFVDKSDWTI